MACVIEGLPADRPLCEHCGKGLAYDSEVLESTRVETGRTHYDGSPETKRRVLRRRFTRWRGYSSRVGVPFFCRLQCALEFATNIVAARRAVTGRR